MDNKDLVRELYKIEDVLIVVDAHFTHEASMNAALHMSSTVRPAPLAAAVKTTLLSIHRLVEAINAD